MNEDNESPFPEDDSYQDPTEEENLIVKVNKPEPEKKDEKIPIVIRGDGGFHVQAYAGEGISCGFWGEGLGTTIEDGIERAILGVRHNAGVHLTLVKEKRINPTGAEEFAKKIMNYNGNIEDLFKLVYFEFHREKVEQQLGRYSRLEKRILKEQRK